MKRHQMKGPRRGPHQHHQHHPDDLGHEHEDGPRSHRGRGPHHGGPGGPGRRGRGRAPRGDVRAAILLLLADEPRHGYQLMQAIGERSGGRWTPSPGAVYPAISLLEDEGLVTITADSGRKLVTLTDTGRRELDENRETWGDPFAGFDTDNAPDLRRLLRELIDATRQVWKAGSDEQRLDAAKILTDARRDLYLLLAGPEGETDE